MLREYQAQGGRLVALLLASVSVSTSQLRIKKEIVPLAGKVSSHQRLKGSKLHRSSQSLLEEYQHQRQLLKSTKVSFTVTCYIAL